MRYIVMIRRTRSGYSADVPDLPGCVAADKTVESTRKSISQAVSMHIDMMRRSGEAVPNPRSEVRFAAGNGGQESFCTWVEVPRNRATGARAKRT